jgi:hypothetical protein
MKGLRRIPCLGLVIAALGFGLWEPVSASNGPILKQRAESELEVDLGMIVDDFTPILAELAATEDESAPKKIRAFLGLLGLNALDRLKMRSTLDDELAVASMTVTLDPSSDGGLLSDAFAIRPGRFEFGRYLREDEPAVVIFAAGIGERIGALEKMFARPEMRELAPMAPTDPLSLTQMWGVDMRKDILPFLSGELDMLMFPCREEQACESPNVAIVLGLTDGPAFRETLLDILTKIMGEEQGTELRTTEGEKAGSFTFYPAWPGLSYAIAPDFGIVTTDPEGLQELVGRRGRGGFPAVEATSYVRINGDLLVTMFSGLAERAGDESPEAAIVAEILRTVGEEPIGTVEMTARTGDGKLEMELRVPASLYATEYRLLKEFLVAAPKLQAIRAPEDELQAILGEVDEALTPRTWKSSWRRAT